MESYNKKLKKLPQRATYLTELTIIGKRTFGENYHGTYPSDQIPSLKPRQCCILNLDKSSEPGSHWVALARGNSTECYVYDSFGRRGVDLIPALNWSLSGRVIDSDRDAEQHVSESNCGARCLAWLHVLYTKGVKIALNI
jgi:hypothetical protein